MANRKLEYGTPTALTITLASLATATYRQSTEVDNTSDKNLDAMLAGKITTGTTPTTGKTITIHAFAGDNQGTPIRGGGVGASDASYTPAGEENQLPVIHIIKTDATSNHVYEFALPSICALAGWKQLPPRWGIVITHDTAVNLNSTGSNHSLTQTPIYETIN